MQTMLPAHERSPTVLTRTLRTDKGPLRLCIGAATSLTNTRPGNGGFRLLTYETDESMAEECVGLAQGMEIKVRLVALSTEEQRTTWHLSEILLVA